MTNKNDDLILHLKLDDINTKDNTVLNSADPKIIGKVKGAALVSDEIFGKCFSFDGKTSYIEIPDCEQLRIKEYTVMVWINPNRTPEPPEMQGIVGKRSRNFNIWLKRNGSIHHAYTEANKTYSQTEDTLTNSIKWNEWNHVAITNDGAFAKTYINGKEFFTKTAVNNLIVMNTPLTIGRNLNAVDSSYFSGKMAHVRIYRQALSETGIAEDIRADKNAHDLLVHLKLDDINTKDNTVLNSANPNMNASVTGAELVADDIFGACLRFKEKDDFVQIIDSGLTENNPAHTLEAWVKLECPREGNPVCILVLGYGNESHHWLLSHISTDVGKLIIGFALTYEIRLQEWMHLATTYKDGQLKLYLNGLPVAESHSTFNIIEKKLTLARGLFEVVDDDIYFKGQLAHVRLYNRALTAEEIKADMLADKMSLPAYRDAHPIAFSLCDEDENYVLYIDDDPKDKQPLTLELRNTSGRAIQFVKNGERASVEKYHGKDKDNYHFRLVFRSGTLSEKTLTMLKDAQTTTGDSGILRGEHTPNNWDIFSPGEDEVNGTTSLYFFYKVNNKLFDPNQRLIIPLQNINAQAGAGARGTRIELRLNQLKYSDDTVAITGSRVQHLQIINRLGSRRMPLHVSFVGSNRILNDKNPPEEGSKSTLTLQLMNVLQSEFDAAVTLTPESKIEITFDVEANGRGEKAPWSLCTEEEAKAIKIAVLKTEVINKTSVNNGIMNVVMANNDKNELHPQHDDVSWKVEPQNKIGMDSPVWRLSPRTNIVLYRDHFIQLIIFDIESSLPSGLTNLYLDYKKIEGFWDGQVVCTIEKAPLLFRPGKNSKGGLERRVGIDTTDPQNVLDVKGSVVIGRNYAGKHRAPDNTDLLVEGNVGIGTAEPRAKLSVMGGVHIGGTSDPGMSNLRVEGDLEFKALGLESHVFISRKHLPERDHHHPDSANSSLFIGIYDGGWAGLSIRNERHENGTRNNQYLTFLTHLGGVNQGERMRIAPNGNVGIGSTAPQAKLSVMGGVNIGEETDPGTNNLNVLGTVTAKEFIGQGAFVKGMILMWCGKKNEIPPGWALCDGNDGTPNLQDRFIYGSNADLGEVGDPKRLGGEATHTHSMQKAGSHNHDFTGSTGRFALTLFPDGNRNNTGMDNSGEHTHGLENASSLPPYYKMAFIMKL